MRPANLRENFFGCMYTYISSSRCETAFRRFVWNFFRLENEHLNNCGKFRAVRDISIAPIDSSDQTQILRMMDEEDGVINRGKRKGGGKKQSNTKEDKRALLKDETIDHEISNASLM